MDLPSLPSLPPLLPMNLEDDDAIALDNLRMTARVHYEREWAMGGSESFQMILAMSVGSTNYDEHQSRVTNFVEKGLLMENKSKPQKRHYLAEILRRQVITQKLEEELPDEEKTLIHVIKPSTKLTSTVLLEHLRTVRTLQNCDSAWVDFKLQNILDTIQNEYDFPFHTPETTLKKIKNYTTSMYTILRKEGELGMELNGSKLKQRLTLLDVFRTNILENEQVTVRGLWYEVDHVFPDEKKFITELYDLIHELKVSRASVGIFPLSDGRVFGNFNISSMDSIITNYSTQPDGIPIDSKFDEHLTGTVSVDGETTSINIEFHNDVKPKLLVIIETMSQFRSIVQATLENKSPVIYVVSKGFPSNSTKAAIQFFINCIEDLSVVGFGDCNPCGVCIMASYFSPSTSSNYFFHVGWIGLLPSQILNNDDIRGCLVNKHQTLTTRDYNMINKLLNHKWINADRERELLIMKESGRKYQGEKLFSMGRKKFHAYATSIIEDALSQKEAMDNQK